MMSIHPLCLMLLLSTAPATVLASTDGVGDSSATATTTPSRVIVYSNTWFWMSTAVFFVFFYTIAVLASYPFMRYRTGIPVLFLFLIILFPPSFFFLLAYLLILRLGYLTTVWFVMDEREREEREARRVARLSQAQRRGRV